MDNRQGFGNLDGLPIALKLAVVAIMAAGGDEPKPTASEARPLKKHNVNVQKTVQSWKCRMLTLSFMSFVFEMGRRWTIGLNREGL